MTQDIEARVREAVETYCNFDDTKISGTLSLLSEGDSAAVVENHRKAIEAVARFVLSVEDALSEAASNLPTGLYGSRHDFLDHMNDALGDFAVIDGLGAGWTESSRFSVSKNLPLSKTVFPTSGGPR